MKARIVCALIALRVAVVVGTSACGPTGLVKFPCPADGACGLADYTCIAGFCRHDCFTSSDCARSEGDDAACTAEHGARDNFCTTTCSQSTDCPGALVCGGLRCPSGEDDFERGGCKVGLVGVCVACSVDGDCEAGACCLSGSCVDNGGTQCFGTNPF